MAWADGLSIATVVDVVSLLGGKRNGTSEFKYYPFRSCEEPGTKPTFQTWLDEIKCDAFLVHEYPTTDYQEIPSGQVDRIVECVRQLLSDARIVVVLDSAGAIRTKQVRDAMGITKLRAKLTQGCV